MTRKFDKKPNFDDPVEYLTSPEEAMEYLADQIQTHVQLINEREFGHEIIGVDLMMIWRSK